MAKQNMLNVAQKKVVEAAKTGAEGVKNVAGDALGAAASAAAGVVIERVSEALGSGQKKLREAVPPGQYAVADIATRARKKPPRKSAVKRKGSAKKQGATKKRSAGTKKGAGQASLKKSSGRQRRARKSQTKKKSTSRRRGR
jgi:hypothetical protein